MTDLNVVVICGHIFKGISDFKYKGDRTGIYFPLIVNTGNRNGFINVMVFEKDKVLQELASRYIISENKGKRVTITGSLLFGEKDNNSIMIAANNILFTDYLISVEDAAKEKANHIDFSGD